MKRLSRLLALALVASAAMVAIPTAAGAATNATAFESIGGCFASQKQVLLALVMDESASLGDAATNKPGTDPTSRRVTAAQIAVDGIANLASQGTNVDVLVTGFSDDLHVYGPWQQLDPRSRTAIERQIDGFRTRNTGLDTDFYNAMAGVQRELSRRSADIGQTSQPCELVLLFTDGRFDIDSKGAKPYDSNGNDLKAVKSGLGIAALCAPDGPMQRLRNDGAGTITLALTDPSAGANQADTAFLQRLATGNCNTPGDQYGASFDATSASALVGEFDTIATRLRGGTELAGNCSGTQTLPVAAALQGVHIFADAGSPASDLVITPPGKPAFKISARDGRAPNLPGVTVRATTTGDRFVVADLAPAPPGSPGWNGQWTVQFAPGRASARCRISVFETWKPQAQTAVLQRGVPTRLAFEFVGPKGEPTPASALPAGAQVTATLADASPSAKPIPLRVTRAGDEFRADVKLPDSFKGQTALITSVLHLKLAGTDVASSPGVARLRVRESGFPALAPSTLRLSSVTGDGTARGTITVVGDKAYAGVVCISGVGYPTLPPVPVAQLVSTRRGTCARVEPGKSTTLPFTVAVKAHGDGRVNGQLDLLLTGIAGRKITSAVPFTFTITRPVDTASRNAWFFVLLLVGIAVPLLFLWFLSYRSAAFVHPPGLRAARMRVRVFADGSLRRLIEGGMTPPLMLSEGDFADAEIAPGRKRAFEWHDLKFKARWSWNPFDEPHGEVGIPRQFVTASDGVVHGRRHVTRGRVPLTLPGTWVFALDPEPESGDEHMRAVDGTVSVFIAAGAPFADQAPRVMQSFTRFFTDLARSIDTRDESRTEAMTS